MTWSLGELLVDIWNLWAEQAKLSTKQKSVMIPRLFTKELFYMWDFELGKKHHLFSVCSLYGLVDLIWNRTFFTDDMQSVWDLKWHLGYFK